MRSIKGIRRAVMTLSLLAFGSHLAHAGDGMTCPEFTRPENWRLPLMLGVRCYRNPMLIDHGAKDGPPDIARAAAVLRSGQREKAVALLTAAGKIPPENALRHGVAYAEAVLEAGANARLLDGCR